jgi:cobalt-zinc-cadmium efflux system protein
MSDHAHVHASHPPPAPQPAAHAHGPHAHHDDQHAHGEHDQRHRQGAHEHHGHDHHHHHHHASPPPPGAGRAYAISIALNLAFVAVEAVYGWISGSLALLADAGHNLADVLSLVLAWGAAALATRGPTARLTYGLRGTSILAALVNAVALLLVCGAIGWEAIERLGTPSPVAGGTVMVVAAIGLVVNGASALLFRRASHHDLNAKGAYLHLAADAAVSLGVVVAGALVWWTGRTWIDPLVSLGVVLVIIAGSWALLRDSVHLALAGVPANVDPVAVRRFLAAQPGVREVHDLHIWAMSTTEVALTAHLVCPNGPPSDGDAFLARLCGELRAHHGICHATIQIETGDAAHPCALAPESVV